MTLVQTEPKKIYYWDPIITISDMQWPAPSGFHVPSKDEWVALCGILTSTFSMADSATTMGTYLKMPMAWNRFSDASIGNVGSYGFYWSSTPYDDNACDLSFYPSSISPQGATYRANAFSVRCFKDTPAIPTSSWTTLYNGSSIANWAWVFYNATNGLISVSGDWQTWYTIMDKNLWATSVYNQWNTETNANCWYFYQWGNNYWFAHSWSVTTSSTQVNASNYWPWNYYSSSTYITWSNDWSSVQNDNLWGGVSRKKQKEVKAVYLWENKVRPSWPDKDYLCFTAEQTNSTVKLEKSWTPTAINLETSTDWQTRSDYTFGNAITLSAIWDKVYRRNKSETVTGFSTSTSNYYKFVLSWLIAASGDLNFLLCKNSTDTLLNNYYYFCFLFVSQTSLTMPPKITTTWLNNYCYYQTFNWCTNLRWLPKLPAIEMKQNCYQNMFYWCSSIKLSSTKTWDYTQLYRIPTEWTGVSASNCTSNMIKNTWWTYTSNPSINTKYYLHKDNTIVW